MVAFVLVTPTARAAPPGVSLEMSGTWHEIDPDGAPGLPTRRRGDAAIWDSRANRMFAFGGI
ncbi:MAG: hypothetical protein HY329_25295, partial [Chloroflexi bacterium]|nr:hypothetical protein [Chloroflexota bacterium]